MATKTTRLPRMKKATAKTEPAVHLALFHTGCPEQTGTKVPKFWVSTYALEPFGVYNMICPQCAVEVSLTIGAGIVT